MHSNALKKRSRRSFSWEYVTLVLAETEQCTRETPNTTLDKRAARNATILDRELRFKEALNASQCSRSTVTETVDMSSLTASFGKGLDVPMREHFLSLASPSAQIFHKTFATGKPSGSGMKWDEVGKEG